MSDDAIFALLGEMRDAPIAALKKSKGEKGAKAEKGSKKGADDQTWSRKARERMAAGDDALWNDQAQVPRDMEMSWVRCSEVARLTRSGVDDDLARDRRPMQRLAVEEALRWRAMNRLAQTFKSMAAETLGTKWTRHFEMWLYARRAVCTTCAAGIFPLGKEAESDEELARKLEAAGMTRGRAEQTCRLLGKAARKEALRVGHSAVGQGSRVQIEATLPPPGPPAPTREPRPALSRGGRRRSKCGRTTESACEQSWCALGRLR